MRRAIRALACALGLVAACCAPASAAPSNGQLAAVVDGRLVALNPDGSGLRTLPVTETAITELAFSPDGNRLAFVHGGRISLLDLATGRLTGLTSGPTDANPAWAPDGSRLAFRRGIFPRTVAASGGVEPVEHPLGLLHPLTTNIGWAPDLTRAAVVIDGTLALASAEVLGAPAWAPDDTRIAFANSRGLFTVAAAGGTPELVTAAPAVAPRWSPDSTTLVYGAGAHLRAVGAAGAAPRNLLSAMSEVRAVDWQPCTPGVTVSCVSARPPVCSAAAATVTTQSDQAVELPAPPCSDPAERALTPVLVRAPERGSLAGWRYTPAPGFTGTDTLTYRMSNGITESDLVRVTIFVVPRPAPAPAAPRTTAPPRGAPFLTARAVPRLSHRRRAVVRLRCDQACSLAVRLTARLREPKRTLTGPLARRTLATGEELTLRLRLPRKPRGALRSVWITGRVSNAAGDVRTVKLPVRRPR